MSDFTTRRGLEAPRINSRFAPGTISRRLGKISLGLKKIAVYALLLVGGAMMAFPLFWMGSTSLKSEAEANASQLTLLPETPHKEAYSNILQDDKFLRSYANTIFITVLGVSGTVISITAVAYAFSRVEWPGRDLVFFMMLSTMMIPAQALIVPQYVFFNKINWVGTFKPLVIPGFFAGGAAMIFLLRQFMAQIPREFDEAARIDGASHLKIWWYVILPLCKPAVATITALLFVGLWNRLLDAVIYLQTTRMYTLPIYVTTLFNPQLQQHPWPTIMAASVLTALPLIAVFFVAQRYLLESIVLSGTK